MGVGGVLDLSASIKREEEGRKVGVPPGTHRGGQNEGTIYYKNVIR